MKRLVVTTVFLSSLVLGASAQAATPMTATLAKPVTKETTVIAAHAIFRCVESTCRLASDDNVSAPEACRDLKLQLGPINQIGTAEHPLEADRLAKCNAK